MKKILLVLSLFITLTISGCSVKVPKACATNYPVLYLLNKIGGNYIDTCNLSSNDVIQRASVSSSFEESLEEADVMFYISGLEPYFQIYQKDIADSDITKIDLAKSSAIYNFSRVTITQIDQQEVAVESKYYDGEAFNMVDTYEKDVTIWMEPNAMMSMANTIKDYFVNQYPENAAIFEENYKQLEVDLAQLDAAFQNLKSEGRDIAFVSMTPSFGNWQKSYGFRIYPIITSKYGVLPSKSQLEIIKERIKKEGVRYIAHEENLTADMEELFVSLEAELGLKRIELNNISSITESSIQNNKDYLTLMYENLAQLESMGN